MKKDATPYHTRAYAILQIYENALQIEVSRLVEQGMSRKVNRLQWLAATLIVLNNDRSVRFISNFCKLNKNTKQSHIYY